MSWVVSGTYKGAAVSDADAQAYLRAVETADNQGPLEQGVQQAVNQFVIGCKSDGIWTAIKASCILAGARTLTGALVPLVGTAPTNNNFVSGDYNRKTGLVGDGSTKYLNSNRNNNVDPQNSKHIAVFPTSAATGGTYFNSGPPNTAGRTGIAFTLSAPNETTAQTSINSLSPFDSSGNIANAAAANKLMGLARSSASDFVARFNSTNTTASLASTTPNNGNITLYARPASPVDLYSSARFAFYSIGESLDLALLDARVTTLINAIAAAIP